MSADDFDWRVNFPYDRECRCGECPVCCPGEYERYVEAWDGFYAPAEARVAAGESVEAVLYPEDEDAPHIEAFMDGHFDGRFHEEYERDRLPAFPLIRAYHKAQDLRRRAAA